MKGRRPRPRSDEILRILREDGDRVVPTERLLAAVYGGRERRHKESLRIALRRLKAEGVERVVGYRIAGQSA